MAATTLLHPSWARALVATFLAVLAVPGGAMFVGLGETTGENRELAPVPRLSLDAPSLRALPAAAARYLEDHFTFRSQLVRYQAVARLVIGASPSPDVVVGRDGWFFYASDGAADDYLSRTPFSVAQLEAWRVTLQHTYDWLRSRGIGYVFVIAPDKHAVYPEFMPVTIVRGRESRTDQLVAYMHAHSDVPVLDLRQALAAGKAAERLYHRTDTHWNDRGAFIAYREVVRALQPQARVTLAPRDAFQADTSRVPGMDLAGMMGLSGALAEEDLALRSRQPLRWRLVEPRTTSRYMDWRIVTQHEDRTLPRAVIFRDSFGAALVPFLARDFSRAMHLWQYNFDPRVVAAERPDVVIQEWVGRRLGTLEPHDPFAVAGLRPSFD